MEDPAKEIPGIIQAIVQNEDLKLQEEIVFRYYSESAVLDHPVVFCKGREEIFAAYQVCLQAASLGVGCCMLRMHESSLLKISKERGQPSVPKSFQTL